MTSDVSSTFRGRLSSDNKYTRERHHPPVRNYELCADLKKRIMMTAVERVASQMLQILKTVTPADFIAERSRVDLPYGLFGLKWADFFIRCQENDIYIEALKLMCAETLNKAKMCVVLDDVYDFCARLLSGFRSNDMAAVYEDIANSTRLLTIEEFILDDYKASLKALNKSSGGLNVHKNREKEALNSFNAEISNTLEKVTVSQIILNPIKYRCVIGTYNARFAQMALRCEQTLENTRKSLRNVAWSSHREVLVSTSVQIRLAAEIEMLKVKIEETRVMYQNDSDLYDSEIGYKKNSMLMMVSQHQECLQKLDFFAVDKPRLIAWIANWEIEKRREAKRIIKEEKEQRKQEQVR